MKLLTLSLTLFFTLNVQAQFRTSAEAVLISTVVTDSKGQPILDLTADEFEVRDNGRPQDLRVFEARSTPVDVAIVLDNSRSMLRHMNVVRSAALKLINKLRPAEGDRSSDRAMMVFAGGRGTSTPLTEDREQLKSILQSPSSEASGMTYLYRNIYLALRELQKNQTPDELRKQVVVVLSDGRDTETTNYREDMINLIKQGSATIYTIRPSYQSDKEQEKRLVGEAYESLHTWKQLASITGGLQFDIPLDNRKTSSTLDFAFSEIGDEFSRQYFLGFIPSERGQLGIDRILTVLVKRTGLRARARTKYLPQ